MIEHVFNSVKRAVKNWWISLLVGILAVIVGVWCLARPDQSLLAMTYVFVANFLICGVLDIVFAVSNRNILTGWGWTLTSGIFEILMGILLLTLPTPVITTILIYMIGFWMLFRAVWGIGESCQLQFMGVKGWGWLLAFSILAVIFSFIYLLSPVFAGVFLIVFIGFALIVYGIFRIVLAMKFRSYYKEVQGKE